MMKKANHQNCVNFKELIYDAVYKRKKVGKDGKT